MQAEDPRQAEARLVDWARMHSVQVRLLEDLPEVKTVAQAAEALGVAPAQIAKSVVFVSQDEPLLVLAPGDMRIVDRLVLDHVGGVRNRFRLARPDEVLHATGFPVGGVPPFAHPAPLRTLMEERLLAHDRALFGGGSDRALLEVSPADVARVTRAEPGCFSRKGKG